MSDLPEWARTIIAIFERVGVGAAVLIFLAAVIWKVLPPLTKLLRAWKIQSDKITETVPRFEADFRGLVGSVNRGFERLEDKLDQSLATPCPRLHHEGGASIRTPGGAAGAGSHRGADLSPSTEDVA